VRYLLPRQRDEAGLKDADVEISESAIRAVIHHYTRESGVRNLEREIATICRKVARKVAGNSKFQAKVTAGTVSEYLGKQRYFGEIAKRTASKGVATGLVWTPVGGDIVFVESTVMPGTGKLTMTGQLGDVMKESAQAALSFLRSRSADLKLADDLFNKHDIHIHVPAGAVPKDGPSAGVAIATSLVSALTGRHIDSSVAMTGEITLTGQVLPIGGVKEKVLGAKRAGIKRVVLPKRNEPDVAEDVPPEVKKSMKFFYVDDLSEVLAVALGTRVIKPVESLNGRRNGRQLPAAAR
jgi:ATP-dependent Lon protease